MSIKTRRLDSLTSLAAVFLAITILAYPVNSSDSTRKLDETTPSADPVKCTPCLQSPPPPSPPPPSCPPPPALPPPPPKKPPSGSNCPPPPASFLYITGPPGNLYPVEQDMGAGCRMSWMKKLGVLVACGLLVFLGF